MRLLLTTAIIFLTLGLSAQWKLEPVLDVFGDTTDVTIPTIEVIGSFSNSDSSDEEVKMIVSFVGDLMRFKIVDHINPLKSSEFEIEYYNQNPNRIYFKGSDGIASEAMFCPYSNDKDLFSIETDRGTTNKMLDGGKFLLQHKSGSVFRFAIPNFNGDRDFTNIDINDINISVGTGDYDGSGDGIFGRKVIYRNHAELAAVTASGSGKIYVKACISNDGKVTYCEIDNFNTTIKTKAILKKALKLIKSYRFEPDTTAPKEQCGLIKLFLDINTFR